MPRARFWISLWGMRQVIEEIVFVIDGRGYRVTPALISAFVRLAPEFTAKDLWREARGNEQYERRRAYRLVHVLKVLGLAVRVPGKNAYKKTYANFTNWAKSWLAMRFKSMERRVDAEQA